MWRRLRGGLFCTRRIFDGGLSAVGLVDGRAAMVALPVRNRGFSSWSTGIRGRLRAKAYVLLGSDRGARNCDCALTCLALIGRAPQWFIARYGRVYASGRAGGSSSGRALDFAGIHARICSVCVVKCASKVNHATLQASNVMGGLEPQASDGFTNFIRLPCLERGSKEDNPSECKHIYVDCVIL